MSIEEVDAGFVVQHLENYFISTPPIVSLSRIQTVSDGSQILFSIPFPYIDPSDIVVLVNDVPITDVDWEFDGAGYVQLSGPVTAGIIVEVRRVTPNTPLVTYTDGAVLTGADLNLGILQTLYLIQEWQDLYGAALGGALTQVAGYGAPVTVTPAEMIASVADQVLNSDLAVSLNQRINDIDLNATAILNNAIAVDNINSIIDSLTGVGGVATIIATETTNRINGDTALQTQLTLLGAVNGFETAFILDTSSAYVDPTTSLATRLAGLDAYDANNAAAITTESTARASGDTTLASLITTLTTTVAGNTASIATNATTVAGLSAQYTVKVDVNGHVAGFGLASTPVNGTPVSSFIVQANNFSIVDPGNGLSTPTVPFTVTGGVVYMNSVVINGALIENATITNAQIANLTVGTAQLASGAATQLVSQFGNAGTPRVYAGVSPLTVVLATATITTGGGTVEVDWSANYACLTSAGGAVTSFTLCIYRNGAVLSSGQGTFSNTAPASVSPGNYTLASMTADDTPSAGTYTYTLVLIASGTGSGIGTPAPEGTFAYQNAYIKCVEIKK